MTKRGENLELTVTTNAQELDESVENVFSLHGIDKKDARILKFTYKSPRTMPTISTVLGIPIVECYRRARKLRSLGLLNRFRVSPPGSANEARAKVFYSANPDRVRVVVVNGKSKVHIRRTRVPDGSVFQYAILF